MGRPTAAGAGQPGRRAQARLRDHAGHRGHHGGAAVGRHAVRGDLEAGVARPDRAARIGRPAAPLPAHRRGGPRVGGAVGADAAGRLGRAAAAARPLRLGRRVSAPEPPRESGGGGLGRRVSAREPPRKSGGGVLVRTALGLYPPAWRARYGAEVRALLDDSGGGARAAASLAWHAAPAWAWPPRHLQDGSGRMRSSLATTGIAWALLAGLGAVFVQLTQAQGSTQGTTLAQYPVIRWSYWAFDGCLAASALAVAVGGIPLWLLMLRIARRRRERAWLLAPVIAPAVFLAAAFAVGRLAGRSGL